MRDDLKKRMRELFRTINPETGDYYSIRDVVNILGIRAVNDPKEIEKYCREAIVENEKQVRQFKSGKTKVIGFFIKQVMDKTDDGANPKLTTEILKKILEQE